MMMALKGVKFDGAGFLAGGIWNVFACSFTTIQAMDKWRLQLDSAHQIGLETILRNFLIVDVDGCRGEKRLSRILRIGMNTAEALQRACSHSKSIYTCYEFLRLFIDA
jgi:hypothetical protein